MLKYIFFFEKDKLKFVYFIEIQYLYLSINKYSSLSSLYLMIISEAVAFIKRH